VEVGIGIFWHVIIEHHIDPLNINTSRDNISGNKNSFFEFFELFIFLNSSIFLTVCFLSKWGRKWLFAKNQNEKWHYRRKKMLPVLLAHFPVDSNGWEVHLVKNII
jgi:hypothetical protein